jgi:hypothetical protein
MRLTAKQIEDVRAPSTKYPAATYADELGRIVKGKKAQGRVEERFPGVKPAHVAHMLKGAAKANGASVEIVVHGTYGVCVLPSA